MLRFSVNITILFKEYPFTERFGRAAAAGFGAVEFMSPFAYDLAQVEAAAREAGVRVVQFNFADGNLAAGERGYASHPDRQAQWREELQQALELAPRLGARQINSLAGCAVPGLPWEAQIACLVDNLRWAVPHLERAGYPLLLEALNDFDNPGYLLTRSAHVLSVLDQVASPWVRFQYDVYHMQRMEGNLVETMRRHLPRLGHVQIADCPGRHEPGSGEINYRFVLGALEAAGYDGYVGLEYLASGQTEDSFAWLPFAKRREATAADLIL
jgi:hydroxypyruvate isomerase